MVSIRMVAKKAGVGAGTVSRALNGSGYVAEETKKKIMEVVEELGYKPNELAKNLLKNRSGIIGVMVPDLENPFFAKMMRYFETELFKKNYKCLVCNTLGIMDRQGIFLEMLDRNMVDGIITCVDALPDFPGRNKKAIVAMDRDWGEDVPIVRSDHDAGGILAAKQFIQSGCRHVLQFYTVERTTQPSNIRHIKMEQVLREHGVKVTDIDIKWDAMGYEYNRNTMWKYMELVEGFDGVMSNDIGAMACLAVAHKRGIKIPEQLKIIGYDGTEITNISYPQLTAVKQDCEQIAKKCVESIMKMMDGESRGEQEVLVPVLWQQGGTV